MPSISRTHGPVHFEDLEPHRFEDLARQLVYDFRDWQSIEATGRSGSDDGYDARAFERVKAYEDSEGDADEDRDKDEAASHPMMGNRWMIQVKREKAIGPTKLKTILADVESGDPPYGYLLIASVNFSKATYDAFREDLRAKGVMEFYLWGKAEMEDLLYLPKNDHILFAYFGVSLAMRRRSRVTAIRSRVAAKNKLIRVFGEQAEHQPILLRRADDDEHYPFEDRYQDFASSPRWREYIVDKVSAVGLEIRLHEYFAWVDLDAKQWDCTEFVDLLPRQFVDDDMRRNELAARDLVEA